MIHSARPIVTPVANILLFCFSRFEKWGRTDGLTFCVKIVITTGRDCGQPRGSKKSKEKHLETCRLNLTSCTFLYTSLLLA